MKSVRLLPVVIFAAAALFLFKVAGLFVEGGYVLTGTTVVMAAGDGGHAAPASDGGAGGDGTVASEPTMVDTSPTLIDTAPTLLGSTGAPLEKGHGEPAEPDSAHGAPADHDSAVAEGAGDGHGSGAEDLCAEPGQSVSTEQIGDSIATAARGAPLGDCLQADPRAETPPATEDGLGTLHPITSAEGAPTEAALLQRLAERRAQLDALEAEMATRQALLEAAEKRLEERTAALQALEQRINAAVDAGKAQEEGQFKALVGMYENMKAGDAAAIFNELDMTVLIRLARGMNPRKMAPIMAAMSPVRAQELTMRLADEQAISSAPAAAGDLASLPQIIGQ